MMDALPHNILLSIVIPTYNRSALLTTVLNSLTEQTYGGDNYEIIVVDNNSSDDTREVVKRYVHNGKIRYILETEQGLSIARNRGWKEAKGEYVAYLDDDCKAPPGWLTAATEIIATKAPYCFGGPYFAYYLNQKPAWFKDSYCSNVPAKQEGFLPEGRYLTGGNIVFQKIVLEELNGFSSILGMVGNKIGFAEETEFSLRLRGRYGGEALYFSPNMFVYHLARPEKMKWRWIIKKTWASGVYYQRMCLLSGKARYEDRFRKTLRINLEKIRKVSVNALMSLFNGFKRDRAQYPYFQNYVYEKILPDIHYMGIYYETIHAHFNARRSQ